MTGIIEEFDESSGRIEIGGGYGDVSRIDRDRLISLLHRLPAGDILLSSIPHKDGRAVLAKPDKSLDVIWLILAPTIPEEPSLIERVMRRIRT